MVLMMPPPPPRAASRAARTHPKTRSLIRKRGLSSEKWVGRRERQPRASRPRFCSGDPIFVVETTFSHNPAMLGLVCH